MSTKCQLEIVVFAPFLRELGAAASECCCQHVLQLACCNRPDSRNATASEFYTNTIHVTVFDLSTAKRRGCRAVKRNRVAVRRGTVKTPSMVKRRSNRIASNAGTGG